MPLCWCPYCSYIAVEKRFLIEHIIDVHSKNCCPYCKSILYNKHICHLFHTIKHLYKMWFLYKYKILLWYVYDMNKFQPIYHLIKGFLRNYTNLSEPCCRRWPPRIAPDTGTWAPSKSWIEKYFLKTYCHFIFKLKRTF